MAYAKPLGWINHDAGSIIRDILCLDGNEKCTKIPGVEASIQYSLNITTINDLVGYVLYNGFPVGLGEDTVFMLSILCANKIGTIMPVPETE